MEKNKYIQISLYIGSAIFLCVSVMHCFQHWVFSFGPETTDAERNMIYLFNWAVALALCFMSLVTFTAAKNGTAAPKMMKVISIILVVTWFIRLILEILYPVAFRFLVLNHPTSIIKAGILIILVILVFPYAIPTKTHTNED